MRQLLAGEEAWIVGGAVRDSLLGRFATTDVDVVCREPELAARRYARRFGGAPFPLSGEHGAWRVASGEGTVDFTPLHGTIDEDLARRDFTVNAMAEPVAGGELLDPHGGRGDLQLRLIRHVSDGVFDDDPLRLLRAVRLGDRLDFSLAGETALLIRARAHLVRRAAGERILAELDQLSATGWSELESAGLLQQLGGSLPDVPLDRSARQLWLVQIFGERLFEYPLSGELRRFARTMLRAERPGDGSPRAIHRFRRATEPWSLEALSFVGAADLREAVLSARRRDPAEPLLRGDELGLPPGPEIGRLLELIDEERAVGTVTTREQALELVRREARPARGATDAEAGRRGGYGSASGGISHGSASIEGSTAMSSQFTPPPGGLAESTGNPRTDLSEDETIAVTIVVALVVLGLILLLIGGALAL